MELYSITALSMDMPDLRIGDITSQIAYLPSVLMRNRANKEFEEEIQMRCKQSFG